MAPKKHFFIDSPQFLLLLRGCKATAAISRFAYYSTHRVSLQHTAYPVGKGYAKMSTFTVLGIKITENSKDSVKINKK